jgi:5-methylcytosine-specific restriction endonuclease McrA
VRIQAVRLIKVVPEVNSHLAEGSLSLTVAASIQGTFRRQEKLSGAPLEQDEKRSVIESLLGTSTRDAERKLVDLYPETKIERESAKPIPDGLTRIQFSASKQLMEKLERLKGLLAHKVPSGRFGQLFEEIAEIALKRLEPKPPTEPTKNSLRAPKVNRTRYIKSSTRRIAWAKSQSQCEYIDPVSGRRCESRHALQVDHIHEFSRGGSHELENLRILCRSHNLWREEQRTRPN